MFSNIQVYVYTHLLLQVFPPTFPSTADLLFKLKLAGVFLGVFLGVEHGGQRSNSSVSGVPILRSVVASVFTILRISDVVVVADTDDVVLILSESLVPVI